MTTYSREKICPFVANPFKECYCFNLTSRNIEPAIKYCGNGYEKCEIYKLNIAKVLFGRKVKKLENQARNKTL